MGKEHRLTERRHAILTALEGAQRLSVAELSARFGVSEVTIRNDLQALSAQGLLLRTRGGATAVTVQPELSFDIRQQKNAEEKARIARAAAALVRDGDTIALDASTTAIAMVPYLENHADLTVVTNSLKSAIGLLRNRHVQVIMPGGNLRRDSISLVGREQNGYLDNIHVRIGFFGARGVTVNEGLTDVNQAEIRWKRQMVERCQEVVAIVDSSKIGQLAASTFADLDLVDLIITDADAPAERIDALRAAGVAVVLA